MLDGSLPAATKSLQQSSLINKIWGGVYSNLYMDTGMGCLHSPVSKTERKRKTTVTDVLADVTFKGHTEGTETAGVDTGQVKRRLLFNRQPHESVTSPRPASPGQWSPLPQPHSPSLPLGSPVTRKRHLPNAAYWESLRVIARPRRSPEAVKYSCPFDPRISFRGLMQRQSPVKLEHSPRASPSEWNLFLAVPNISDIVEHHTFRYRLYLDSLKGSHATPIDPEPTQPTGVNRGTQTDNMDSELVLVFQEKSSIPLAVDHELGKLVSSVLSDRVRALWTECFCSTKLNKNSEGEPGVIGRRQNLTWKERGLSEGSARDILAEYLVHAPTERAGCLQCKPAATQTDTKVITQQKYAEELGVYGGLSVCVTNRARRKENHEDKACTRGSEDKGSGLITRADYVQHASSAGPDKDNRQKSSQKWLASRDQSSSVSTASNTVYSLNTKDQADIYKTSQTQNFCQNETEAGDPERQHQAGSGTVVAGRNGGPKDGNTTLAKDGNQIPVISTAARPTRSLPQPDNKTTCLQAPNARALTSRPQVPPGQTQWVITQTRPQAKMPYLRPVVMSQVAWVPTAGTAPSGAQNTLRAATFIPHVNAPQAIGNLQRVPMAPAGFYMNTAPSAIAAPGAQTEQLVQRHFPLVQVPPSAPTGTSQPTYAEVANTNNHAHPSPQDGARSSLSQNDVTSAMAAGSLGSTSRGIPVVDQSALFRQAPGHTVLSLPSAVPPNRQNLVQIPLTNPTQQTLYGGTLTYLQADHATIRQNRASKKNTSLNANCREFVPKQTQEGAASVVSSNVADSSGVTHVSGPVSAPSSPPRSLDPSAKEFTPFEPESSKDSIETDAPDCHLPASAGSSSLPTSVNASMISQNAPDSSSSQKVATVKTNRGFLRQFVLQPN